MTDALRISVLIPCYQSARFLGAAIESALRQTVPPWEIVVVDDGSTDDSAGVVRRCGGSVRYVTQEHAGIVAARNHALQLAGAPLIAFLDADDVWPVDSLALRVAAMTAEPYAEVVAGRLQRFAGDVVDTPDAAAAARVAGTMLIRRDVFDRIGVFDPTLRVGETMDWVARAVHAGVRIVEIDHHVLHRRVHDANTVRRVPVESDYLRVLRQAISRRRDQREISERQPRPGLP
jgi:glycosyltransferase involved in cell wall biosynthesis